MFEEEDFRGHLGSIVGPLNLQVKGKILERDLSAGSEGHLSVSRPRRVGHAMRPRGQMGHGNEI